MCLLKSIVTRNAGSSCSTTTCYEIRNSTGSAQARFYSNGTINCVTDATGGANPANFFNTPWLFNTSGQGFFNSTYANITFDARYLNISGATTTLPAANITAGTFGGTTGYTFPENLIVTRNFTVSNNILFVDNSTGRVGIGTAAPDNRLHILNSGSAVTTDSAEIVRIQNSGSSTSLARLSIIAGNAGESTIRFGDTDSRAVGQILYNHVTNSMNFTTNGADRVTIDSSGSVGINTTSPTAALSVVGNVNISGSGNGLIFPDGSKQTASAVFDPTTTVEIMEEFVGGTSTSGLVGQNGWRYTGTGINSLASTSNKIGLADIPGGTTPGAGQGFWLPAQTSIDDGIIVGNQSNYTFISSGKNSNPANANLNIRLGLMNTNFGFNDPANGIFFRATGTGNWFTVTRKTGVETTTNTTVAQATTFKTFKIVMNSAGTSVEFFIDGISRATHTTNIPLGSVTLSPMAQVELPAGGDSSERSFHLDYAYLKVTGLSR